MPTRTEHELLQPMLAQWRWFPKMPIKEISSTDEVLCGPWQFAHVVQPSSEHRAVHEVQ